MARKHGGARPGAGRKPGKVGAAKRALSEMAKGHAEDAIQTLAAIHADREAPSAARVSAAVAILDRAYGKPPQMLDLTSSDGSMSPKPTRIEFVAPQVDDESDG
ncbi:hypothetical protein JYP52_19745 [Nitratireductor aquibiodomus]|uniref:hypothetical protein n=1 Tax=Nitratireductor aquibiodomus TaxID=204799 RepID=UPI0019D3E003|nr:hypothetical protein [Nitratireductor aquibiodomus]MBN7763381.1 hypothetical protein [Nitratireductor aquibiodomus]